MSFRNRCAWLLGAFLLATLPLKALTITGYTSTANDVYSSGYPGAPVRNTSLSFVGAGYDFSGVGWSSTDATKSFGFLSPDNYLVARHYGGSTTIDFFGNNSSITAVTQSKVEDTTYGIVFSGQSVGDISVGTLTSPVPTGAQTARYAVLDLNPSSGVNDTSAYVGQSIFVFGRGPNGSSSTRVGTATISSVFVSGMNRYFTTSLANVQLEVGDSGSPDFIGWTNPNGGKQLTIIGNNAAVDGSNDYFNFLGTAAVMSSLNTIMNPSGYALQVVGNPAKTWTGSGGNTNFSQSGNWSAVTPSDEFVLFDAATATSTSVNMNVAGNLRGLYFKSTASTSDGFTISGSSTLTIGRGGITNYDNSLQTFSAPITLGSSQYWNSGTGGIQAANINTNGNLLELGGVGTTTITGDISGSGSVALSGTKATLTGTSSYTGTTWVHTGQLVVNGSIATSMVVNVEAGASVAGSGTVSALQGAGSIDPGNSPGILTATSVNPDAGMDFNFEFTTSGTPTYGSPTNSGNDILRLTSLTPFTSALDSDNVISIYLDIDNLIGGSNFIGGFFVGQSVDLWSSVQNAAFAFYLKQTGGSVTYNGVAYNVYSGPFTFDVTAISESPDYGAGPISSQGLQIHVVPEPSTVYLLLLGGLLFAGSQFRRLKACSGVS